MSDLDVFIDDDDFEVLAPPDDFTLFAGKTSDVVVMLDGNYGTTDIRMLVLDQATYDALSPDPNTLYFVTA